MFAAPRPRTGGAERRSAPRRQWNARLREGYEGGGYVLVDERGGALNGRRLRKRACGTLRANALRRLRLYDARASCLTYPVDNGVPDHLLSMRAGHPDTKTAKNCCVKPDAADLPPAAEVWGGLAGGV
ncbi:hypothetical protein TPA0906_13770 [Streptomyces olivaceus]|nr:hypothetical protein TPA0906_13770 [Streptomyces olivaceus]